MSIEKIIAQFQLHSEPESAEPFGGGHIHDTYQIRCAGAEQKNYLLQKVNRNVFRNIDGLMRNIDIVTTHTRNRMMRQGITDLDRRSLELIKTNDGRLYHEDGGTDCWRIYNFIEDHQVYDRVTDRHIAYEGANMFGKFIYRLSDLSPDLLVDSIPDFHNVVFRLNNLENAIKEDSADRLKYVSSEVSYARDSQDLMSVIHELGRKGVISPRVVHNDTKINNVLFDEAGKGLCVIDLDTVMPGYIAYDFGDGIRTSANTADEDEEDLGLISYDMDIFEAFTQGFIDSTGKLMSREEIDSLAYAALLFPFIMGIRFLTDYLEGDKYYKTQHEDHNMMRARAQLKLAIDGESKFAEMQTIIRDLTKGL